MNIPLHTFMGVLGAIPYIILLFAKKERIFFFNRRIALIIAITSISFTIIDGTFHSSEHGKKVVAGEGFEPPT